MPASKLLLPPATAYFFFGLVTRDPRRALSTLDNAHRAHRPFLVGGDGGDVALLQRT
jgi:hypothetical protein